MKDDVRDALGKAAYEAYVSSLNGSAWDEFPLQQWEAIDSHVRASYCLEAEAVVNTLAEMLLPVLVNTLLAPEQIEAIIRSMA